MDEIIEIKDPRALLSLDGKRAVESFQFRLESLHLSQNVGESVLNQFMECISEVAADCYAAGISEGERRVIEKAKEMAGEEGK